MVSHYADAMDEPNINDPAHLSIGELSERADVTRRTIRFYIQRGLLSPPLGGGRGSHYTQAHLERLIAVKRLQEVGIPLEVILSRLGPPTLPTDTPAQPPSPSQASPTPRRTPPPNPAPQPTSETWLRHTVAPGVDLLIRDGALTRTAIDDLVATARLIALKDQLDRPSPARTTAPDPDDA